MARQTRTIRPKKVSREEIRAGLDPMFYADIETFRKAVADGSIDREKGCRDMTEYLLSVSRHESV